MELELKTREREFLVRSCHRLAMEPPGDNCPVEGTAQRLIDCQTGLERWQGLATSISIDLKAQEHEESTQNMLNSLEALGYSVSVNNMGLQKP